MPDRQRGLALIVHGMWMRVLRGLPQKTHRREATPMTFDVAWNFFSRTMYHATRPEYLIRIST